MYMLSTFGRHEKKITEQKNKNIKIIKKLRSFFKIKYIVL